MSAGIAMERTSHTTNLYVRSQICLLSQMPSIKKACSISSYPSTINSFMKMIKFILLSAILTPIQILENTLSRL